MVRIVDVSWKSYCLPSTYTIVDFVETRGLLYALLDDKRSHGIIIPPYPPRWLRVILKQRVLVIKSL